MASSPAPRREASHDRRIFSLALAAGLPAAALSLWYLWSHPVGAPLRATLTPVILGGWIGGAFAIRYQVIRPLQTLASLLAGLREGDYSSRGRGAEGRDPLGQVVREINALGDTLQDQRIGALEATALLRRVMEEIDVAVFAFDQSQTLQLVNRAGERLLGRPAEQLLDLSAEDLGLLGCLEGEVPRLVESVAGAVGRWEIRRSSFRQHSRPHELLVLADVSRALRAEERQAWQRLVRVLSHEINNSLAPITSLAATLADLLDREPRPPDWDTDLRSGLAVIGGRAGALSRFMQSYARLAKLPPPRTAPVSVGEWIHRVATLEPRVAVQVEDGPSVTIPADGDQLDQLLINLLRNAADASLETGGRVMVDWRVLPAAVEVRVMDEGPGLSSTSNLFVPFYTTKPQGTGIGLVLCRQIAEGHGGSLTLHNRAEKGVEARIRLPR